MSKPKQKHKPTKGAFGSRTKAQRRAEELALREEFEADRKAALKRIALRKEYGRTWVDKKKK